MKNLVNMMKQAQEMQTKMADMQARLAEAEVTGEAGGGMVTVTLTGKFELRGVVIDPSLMTDGDAEIVQDLIKAAHADARSKAEAMMAESMQEITGGLGLPPGMQLPF
jgi:DNA-binding YbaB/EbfC family protein